MVNTGKPSTGCYMCRARRIKCDEAKPNCMRCQKSKRVCPGYRNVFDLNHRDATKTTKRKVSVSENTTTIPSSTAIVAHQATYWTSNSPPYSARGSPPRYHVHNHSRHSSVSSISSINSQVSMSKNLSIPIQQQASCYFVSNYVLQRQEIATGSSSGYLAFVLPLLKSATPGSAFELTFNAVACAAFASRPNSKQLLPATDHYYVSALKAINTALLNPVLAQDDSTLASALLLSTFEAIITSGHRNKSWGFHVDGAVALVKARSKEDFQNPVAAELFTSVRAHMAVQCMAKSAHVEPSVEWWMNQVEEDEMNTTFTLLSLKVAELRADCEETLCIAARTPSSIENTLKVLRVAEALEQEYLTWIASFPKSWLPKTVAFIDNVPGNLAQSILPPGRIDTYEELWLAYVFNFARSSRLYIWNTIIRCMAWLGEPHDYRITPEYTTASRICMEIIGDIVASTPYFFGWRGRGTSQMPASDCTSAPISSTKQPTIKPVSGIFLLWPIFTAISSDFTTETQKTYLRGRLRAVHEATGMNQASVLLDQSTYSAPSVYIHRERRNHSSPNPKDSEHTGCIRNLAEIAKNCTSLPLTPKDIPDSIITASQVIFNTYDRTPSLSLSPTNHPIQSYPEHVENNTMSPPLTPDLLLDPSQKWMEDWDMGIGAYTVGHHFDDNAIKPYHEELDFMMGTNDYDQMRQNVFA